MDFTMDCVDAKNVLQAGVIFFDGFNGRLWELCPWDKSHYAKKENMEEHLEECKKQVLRKTKQVECPFNALHIVNRMEIEHHIMTCENRTVVTNSLLDFEPKRETIEGVIMEPLNVALKKTSEWDDKNNVERGYDPDEMTKFQLCLRVPPPGLSKKKKKEWRANECKRWKSLGAKTKHKPPRSAPYPSAAQIKNARAASQKVAAVKNETDIIDIVNGLSGANIADPRDSAMRQINARLQRVQALEARLKDEKTALRGDLEQYLASIGDLDEKPDISILEMQININEEDPRINNNDPRKSMTDQNANKDPRTANLEHTSRIFPDVFPRSLDKR